MNQVPPSQTANPGYSLRFAIIFAACSGLIFLLPHVYLTYTHGFSGYEKTLSGDEVEYSARIVGRTPDPYAWETRNASDPHERLPVLLFSAFEWALGIEKTLIFWDFLGPALLVFALFQSARILTNRQLSPHELLAIGTAALACVCFTYVVGYLNLLYAKGFDISPTHKWYSFNLHHVASRIFYPSVNLPIFLLAISWIIKLTRTTSNVKSSFAAGILLGGLIYIRIFDFIVGGACIGILITAKVIELRHERHKIVRQFYPEAAVLFGFILSSAYRLITLLLFRLNNPDYLTGTFLRSHRPHFRAIGVAIAFALGVWMLHRWIDRNKKTNIPTQTLFLPTLVIAGAAVSDNLQIVLGTNLENGHYWWDYLQPMLAFGGVLIFLTMLWHRARGRLVSATILVVLLGLGSQAVFASRYKEMYRSDPAQRRAYAWIRDNTEDGDVIGSNYYPSMVVMYTGRRTFFPFSAYSPIPIKQLLDRYLMIQGVMGYPMQDVFGELLSPELPFKSESEEMLYHFPTRTSRARRIAQLCVRGSYDEILPVINSCREDWSVLSQEAAFKRLNNSGYKLDYLIVTDHDRESVNDAPDRSPYLQLVFSEAGFSIYRFKR